MLAGLSELTDQTVTFALVAAAMVGLNLYVLRRLLAGRSVPSLSTFILGATVLVSQVVFWAGIAYYLEVPTVDGFVILSLAVQFMMVPAGAWFVSLVFEAGEKPVGASGSVWPALLGVLLLANEIMMSWAFAALVAGTLPSNLTAAASFGRALLVASSTAWYYWPMAASMAVLVRWSGLPRGDRWPLYALSLTAAVAPWAFEVPLVGAVAMALAMAGAVALLWFGVTAPGTTWETVRLRMGVAAALIAMAVSWLFSSFLLPPSAGLAPFAVTMVAVMTGELIFLLATLLRNEGTGAATPAPGPTVAAPIAPAAAPSEGP